MGRPAREGNRMANRKPSRRARPATIGDWRNVLVEIEDGIAWVTMNRPEKRNAMSPALTAEMLQVLDALEIDDAAGVSCSPAPATPSPPAWT